MGEGTPIYLQIMRHIKSGIVAGSVKNGDELPSRRVLSSLLGVNPNTIQKAYKLLEDEGVIESHPGAKSYISVSGEKMESIHRELVEGEARSAVISVKKMGIGKDEALSLFSRLWDESEDGEI
jgi:GntR family transcriptional regulator